MNNIINVNENSAMLRDSAHVNVSEKYKFINTYDIVAKFAAHGWVPTKYTEARTRKYQGYQTHQVQLTHPDDGITKVGDSSLRILIINNHHASKSMVIKLGLFRLVCSNGLVVEDAGVDSIKVRHMGLTIDDQIAAFIEKITVAAERLRARITYLSQLPLSIDETKLFTRAALATRFDPDSITDAMVAAASRPNRIADAGGSAWTVFNTVQENIIRGFEVPDMTRRIRRITSLARDTKINEQLWSLLPKAA